MSSRTDFGVAPETHPQKYQIKKSIYEKKKKKKLDTKSYKQKRKNEINIYFRGHQEAQQHERIEHEEC
jgi:hypothetical protein